MDIVCQLSNVCRHRLTPGQLKHQATESLQIQVPKKPASGGISGEDVTEPIVHTLMPAGFVVGLIQRQGAQLHRNALNREHRSRLELLI